MKNLLIILALILATASCKTKQDATAAKADNQQRKSDVASSAACFDSQNDIRWSVVPINRVWPEAADASAPPTFFTVDNKMLQRLVEINFQNQTSLTLTLPFIVNNRMDCKTFDVRNSDSVSRTEQKNEQVYFFLGREVQRPDNKIQLTFNPFWGLQVNATFDNQLYFLKGTNINGQLFYVCYNTENADFVESKFDFRN